MASDPTDLIREADEALDALPAGAHIREKTGAYWDKQPSGSWWIPAGGVERTSQHVARYLPAIVLWLPEVS